MTANTLPHLLAAIQNSDDEDFLRVLAETTLNRLMDFDAEEAPVQRDAPRRRWILCGAGCASWMFARRQWRRAVRIGALSA